jgi:hypothetical protein
MQVAPTSCHDFTIAPLLGQLVAQLQSMQLCPSTDYKVGCTTSSCQGLWTVYQPMHMLHYEIGLQFTAAVLHHHAFLPSDGALYERHNCHIVVFAAGGRNRTEVGLAV